MDGNKNTHKHCYVCGQEIHDTWGYCAKCGVQLRRRYADLAPKARVFCLMNDLLNSIKNLDVVCSAVINETVNPQDGEDALSFVRDETFKRLDVLADAVRELLVQEKDN